MRAAAIAAALLAAGPGAAQVPAVAPAPGIMPELRAAMHLPGEPGAQLEFVAVGEHAALRAIGRIQGVRPIASVGELLSLLGDARLAFLHPAILDWAGADLSRARDRFVAQAHAAWEAGDWREARGLSESTTQGRGRALLQYALALHEAGRSEEALALLGRERRRPALGEPGDSLDWVLASVRAAVFRRDLGDAAGAIDALAADAVALGEGNEYAVNLDVNRAAFLAEAGRHAEALALADRALASFKAKRGHGDRVPGSAREFAWIRACALHGLGRAREAAVALRPALSGGDPVDRQFLLKSSAGIRFRAHACMGDAPAAAATLAAELEAVRLGSNLYLQPGYRGLPERAALLAAVRADPKLRAATAGRVRALPPELEAALNHWRAR